MLAALEILSSGSLNGHELVVSDDQKRALRVALDELDELKEAEPRRQGSVLPSNNFFLRG
ncbi:MAG: hypothetical protein JWP97_610 [Labilithrix sp.]|nr:hypothetical protein [Labilithrix sp.]